MQEYLTVAQAAQLIPGRPHVATVWRYVLNGVGGRKLSSVKIGGKRFVTQQAIDEFLNATDRGTNTTPSRSAKRNQRDAERELKEQGVL